MARLCAAAASFSFGRCKSSLAWGIAPLLRCGSPSKKGRGLGQKVLCSMNTWNLKKLPYENGARASHLQSLRCSGAKKYAAGVACRRLRGLLPVLKDPISIRQILNSIRPRSRAEAQAPVEPKPSSKSGQGLRCCWSGMPGSTGVWEPLLRFWSIYH